MLDLLTWFSSNCQTIICLNKQVHVGIHVSVLQQVQNVVVTTLPVIAIFGVTQNDNLADSLLHINVVVTPKPYTCSTCVWTFFLVYVSVLMYGSGLCTHLRFDYYHFRKVIHLSWLIVILKQLHTKYCIIIKQYWLFPLSFSSAVYCCAPVSLRSGRR